ncbi:beta-1,3-galactosyltransferase 4-like [Anolis sagrei]|uniref:beta-1,3-galactosyltransferase 4-like n=1 Tax=Anolis sagrei TaxID=38937 RepID=UPI003520298D
MDPPLDLQPSMMVLPVWPKCCYRPRLLRGLLSTLMVLLIIRFLVSGGHEDLFSHSLRYFMSGRRHPTSPPLLPSSDDFLLRPPPEVCSPTAPSLLVLVVSAPRHATQRQAIRSTWGGARRAGKFTVQIFFVLGLPREPSLQTALEQEAAGHHDLVQGRFLDTYGNLTLKTLSLMGWAAVHCPGTLFVVKVDDDIFLNLPGLAEELEHHITLAPTYLGKIYWRARPKRDSRSRNYIPVSLYPEERFPVYCSGAVYVLSGAAIPILLGASRHVPLVPVEDVFVGLCAHWAGIVPQRLARLTGGEHFPPDRCCYQGILLSVHKVTPVEMAAVWDATTPYKEMCQAWQWALGYLRCKALAWMADQ